MDYPDPDEEFELMYAEEFEAMQDFDVDDDDRPKKKSKKSLDFGSNTLSDSPAKLVIDEDMMELEEHLVPQNIQRSESPPCLGPPVIESSPSLEQVQLALNSSSVRKRKAAELFGNIDDIGSDDEFSGMADLALDNFKKKGEEDIMASDDILIDRIRRERNKMTEVFNAKPGFNKTYQTVSNGRDCEFITERVPRYPFITLRNFDNEKFYVRLRADNYVDIEAAKITSKTSGMLPGSYQSTWVEANTMLEQKQQMCEVARKCDALDVVEWGEVEGGGQAENERLWVEKYQPRGYKDLLSDEGTNKTLLKWLKMWDPIVFNIKKKPKVSHHPRTTALAEVKNPWAKKGKFQNNKFPSKVYTKFQKNPQSMLSEEVDAHGRPTQKVALLCGPPGLGKTTLAHIIAKHAGYNPVEVNASDDCSADAFRLQLEAATQMRSVIGDNPRPNCLILDEIDGSLSAAIEVLLQFISDKDVSKGKKKKNSKPRILKRPIICICNDLYVPALRPLRQVALIINFPPTASARLAQRLMEVAVHEKLKTDLGALLLLCEKTGNDIRSCLSFLHFHRTRSQEVRLKDVQCAAVGQKDTHKSLFAVWTDIFQISRQKSIGVGRDNGPLSISSRMGRILRTVQSYGDYDRLSQGVFENYLTMKMRDTRFQSISHGTEWFCFFDQLNTTLRETQNYCLMPYMPYCFATWHFLYAGMSWPKIKYPQSNYEVMVKTQHSQMTLSAVLRGMDPGIRSGTKAAEMLIDSLPLILYAIMPCLKNVNAQLFSVQEKAELHRVVSVFAEYNITYVQERTALGDIVYRMEPNVPELVQFPDVPHAPSASYAVKQLIAYEVESERIRRVSQASGMTALQQQTPSRTPTTATPSGAAQPKSKPVEQLPNHLQTLSPQIRKVPTLKPGLKNWLSISKNTATVAKEKAAAFAAESGLQEITFSHKEGYSNAVRKTVRIGDLL